MTIRTITLEEVQQMLAAGENVILLDIHPGEFFAEEHIPGARNACVYEVTFLEQVRAITTDLDRPIIAYGSSSRSLASARAVEKLAAAGYRNLYDFAGGLDEWNGAGCPLERHPEQAVAIPVFRDATYVIDVEQSALYWVGRSLAGRHSGRIDLAGGELRLAQGTIVVGSLTIAMETIKNLDLTDPAYNALLISHLKSDDFFHVSRFPTAAFEFTADTPIPDATPGTPNHQVSGMLTIKGISMPVVFPALIAPRADGGISAQAHFDIDRTQWGVLYGSGKLFEKLGIHLVNDIITLELQLVAF
jgi:polyisoprenoid-binding protein YceI/rhodanese-related sulfurtransferase